MKSCRLFLIVLLFFLYLSLNAQVFVGGNVGFNNSKTELDGPNLQKVSNFSLGLTPRVGKFLSDKLAIGLALDISLSGNKTSNNYEILSRTSSFGVSPYLRYYALRWNKVSVFGHGGVGLSFTNEHEEMDGVTHEGPKGTKVYFTVYPGLSYDISEKFSLESSINILSLGYSYYVTKEGSVTNKKSIFNIGAGLNNIVSVGSITIGAIYKF